MGIEIKEEKDPEYDLVLLIKSGDIESKDPWFVTTTKCGLKIKGDKSKVIDGVISACLHSKNVLDDDDYMDHSVNAERESISFIKCYLKIKFPGAEITGIIKSIYQYIYYPEREYKI